ncbi:hypothetical protein OHB49_45650 (plasmid) [Streptomyces sp. NBC_01717]|uniref:hypothetical protein n=1 Tax=Streptomyces sp. NBC_01717 TaxID=2975918 RepID=UPI002E320949|nr:hypothetical protein [Streptomyces sp. NBC_01717]
MTDDQSSDALQISSRRAAEALADSPGMRRIREQVAAMATRSIQPFAEALARHWSPSLNAQLEAIAADARRSVADSLTGFSFDILQNSDALRQLNLDARAAAARILEESYASAESGTASSEVPEELLATIEESARSFAESESGLLPDKAQRSAFIWFIGIMVFLALMQAAVSSEAAKEMIENSASITPVAAAAMLAAGRSWDRVNGRAEDDEQSDE